jgi:hypothetical protein
MWEPMLKITDSVKTMQEGLALEFFKIANSRVRRNAGLALARAKIATLSFLTKTPTYQSLVSGELAYHFGFNKGTEESVLQPILNTFVDSIHYEFIPFSKIGGSFTFYGVNADYSDVFSLPEAKIAGKNKPELTTRYPLPWLNWLLLQGDAILVQDYKIVIGTVNRSKTGKAVMIHGGTWSIPSEFRGTASNNWITKMSPKGEKAVSEYDKTMQKIMEGLLV